MKQSIKPCLNKMICVTFKLGVFVCFGGREEWCKRFLGLIGGECRKNEFWGEYFY